MARPKMNGSLRIHNKKRDFCAKITYFKDVNVGTVCRKLMRELAIGLLSKKEILELYYAILSPRHCTKLHIEARNYTLRLEVGCLPLLNSPKESSKPKLSKKQKEWVDKNTKPKVKG